MFKIENEGHFEEKLIKLLRECNCYAKKMDTNISGFPDIMVCKNNKILFAELKYVDNVKTKFKNKFQDFQLPFLMDISHFYKDVYLFVYDKTVEKVFSFLVTDHLITLILNGINWLGFKILRDCETSLRIFSEYVSEELLLGDLKVC